MSVYVNELSTSEHVDAIDLLSGQVHVYFGPILESIEHARVGKLWPLAVTTAERVETLADIPSLAEFVPGYEASGWHGVGAHSERRARQHERRRAGLFPGQADEPDQQE